MLSKTKKILKESLLRLDSSVFSTRLCLGFVLAPTLFVKGERALLIDVTNDRAVVFATNKKEADYSIMVLTELIALVKSMKQNGLLLAVDYKKTDLELLYSASCNDLQSGSIPNTYSTSDGCELVCSPDLQLKDGAISLSGFSLPTQLFPFIKETLLAVFFPTPDLIDYLNRGFCSPEFYQTKRALRVSRISVIVAFLIGVLSPFAAVFLGNKWGHSTIESKQFNEIICSIRDND